MNQELELLEGVDEIKLKAVKFLLDENITYDIEDAISRAEDVTVHQDTTLEDYSYELMQELYDIKSLPSIIQNNIDYNVIARDLE